MANKFNIPWLAFTGKQIEYELGDGWAKGVHPDDLQRCIDIYVTAFDLREKFSMNYRIRHNSGELVMDDEEVMRDSIGDMLESLGYTIISKENGKDALTFFATKNKANRTIVGMIFDLTVPGGMGGKVAIEEIRKTNKDIPAFVASGYSDDPVMKNPTEYGFTASICKPFRKFELSEMLNKYIKPKK